MAQTLQATVDRETLQLAVDALIAFGAKTLLLVTRTRPGPVYELVLRADGLAEIFMVADANSDFTEGKFTCEVTLLEQLLGAVPIATTNVALLFNTVSANLPDERMRAPAGMVAVVMAYGGNLLTLATAKAAEVT